MSFLDAKSHDALFSLPELYEEALSRFALSGEDVVFARTHRRSHNRLGFAIQLALVRDLGRTLRAGEIPTETVIAVVAEQLDIDPAVFTLYAQREETRREHAREIVAALGLRSVRISDYRMLILAAAREAATTERGLPITRAVIDKLKDKKLLVPVPTQLIRLAMAGRAAARRLSYRELIRDLESSSITALEQLLTERVGERSLFGWIAEAPEGVKLKNLRGLIARLEVLRAAAISDEQRKRIHVNRYGIIARDSRVLHAREIQRLSSERRHATLAAFVIEKQAAITDLAINMSRKWQRRVSPGGKNTDIQAWEVAVFVHLRERLKTGDIWVDGSRAWRSFEDYLLPRHVFDQMRAESRLGLAIPDNFAEWRAERTATLNSKLKALAKAAAENAIPDAELSDRGLSVSPVREEDSDRITTLSRRLYMLVPRIRITSLLAEVHSWTNFLDCFTHYRTGEQAEDEAALMAAILADATNAGAERMAQSSLGVTIHQMMVMVDRHLRAETYASATSVLVDAQQEHPFAAIWGDGHVSSSDGQFFPAGGRGEASLEYNAKYGKRPGASIYGFLSNRFASFFSRMIQASESEAPYVLDGLLHNESSVEIHEHATDTAGATETTFSMFHSFGYRLIPRIRNLGSRRLYVITPSEEYSPLDALIAGRARMDVIEQHWDEVLRLKASIGAGLVPSSVILKKLAASPRQNRLNQTLREMGRIERSIFICDWLLDTRLRRRSHAILNKGESRHALARAIFLHQLGELRNRAAEAMAYRASGLNLVVNAIVLWNTVYLRRAVDYVRSQGIIIPEELLSSVAPLPWGHISLTGDYLWNEIDRPLERYRPVRTKRFNPKNFIFP